jgi:DNA polymerase IIIc chi subunit
MTSSCRTAAQRMGFAEHQPVWLTAGEDAPNGATVRFLVEGAECAPMQMASSG